MKTINTLRKVKSVLMTTLILAFLNIGFAQADYASASTLTKSSSILNTGNDLEKSIVKTNSTTEKSVLTEMDQTPEYWVEFLKTTVTDANTETVGESTLSRLLDQMEIDPLYWFNYLKNKVENDNDNNILNTMNNDAEYWQHYLQTTVQTDSI